MRYKIKYECNHDTDMDYPDPCQCGSQGVGHTRVIDAPTRFQAEAWLLEEEGVSRIMDSYPVYGGNYNAKTFFPYPEMV